MYEDAIITVVAAVILYYLDAIFTAIRNKLCKHKILNLKHNDMRRFINIFKIH